MTDFLTGDGKMREDLKKSLAGDDGDGGGKKGKKKKGKKKTWEGWQYSSRARHLATLRIGREVPDETLVCVSLTRSTR